MSDQRFPERERAESRGNRASQNVWEQYLSHRQAQTRTLLASGAAGGKLCLLGAGNCNDVDLVALADHFAEVHLVDIDQGALQRSIKRQPAATRARLFPHGGVDLTGLLRQLDESPAPITTFSQVESLLEPGTRSIVEGLPKDFDLVASCCVSTQLYFGVTNALATGDPMMISLRHGMLVIHLRTMAALLRPGRTAVLFNDLISSETYPLGEKENEIAAATSSADLRALVEDLSSSPMVFEASNVVVLRRILRRDPVLRVVLDQPALLDAWLWNGPKDRTYLVYAMTIRRTSTAF